MMQPIPLVDRLRPKSRKGTGKAKILHKKSVYLRMGRVAAAGYKNLRGQEMFKADWASALGSLASFFFSQRPKQPHPVGDPNALQPHFMDALAPHAVQGCSLHEPRKYRYSGTQRSPQPQPYSQSAVRCSVR